MTNKKLPPPPEGMEYWTTGVGQLMTVHAKERCSGMCAIHSPVDDHMAEFPTLWRDDRSFMERICEHGVGHPDSSQMAYLRAIKGEEEAYYDGIHGCCGCCRRTQSEVEK